MTLVITISPITSYFPLYGLSASILFTATPTGYSNLTNVSYQWVANGTNISGANQATYAYTPSALGLINVSCYVIDTVNGTNHSGNSTVTTILQCEACGEINSLKVSDDQLSVYCKSCGNNNGSGQMQSDFNEMSGMASSPST